MRSVRGTLGWEKLDLSVGSLGSVRGTLGWEKLDLSVGSLGVVEAASYSFFDRRLWVLDRDGAQSWRLFRIQPTTGFTELVGSWDDSGEWDWHRLVLDHDGQMLLVRSRRHSRATRWHASRSPRTTATTPSRREPADA